MKNLNILILAFALLGISVGKALAQSPVNHQDKMKIFSSWIGQWQGEGILKQGPGEGKRSSVNERIESKLEGTVLLIEGVGKSTDPVTKEEKIVHHALGVLSFDQSSNQYKFNSYLQDGRSTEAWFTAITEHNFEWGFDIPAGGKTKYSITLDPVQQTWTEIGEYSRDGTTWMKFFEMNLKKVKD